MRPPDAQRIRTPEVEILWWEGCPSTERARADVERALSELGLDPTVVRMREIETDAQAEDAGFVGSPTILIDGRDLAPSDEPTGLSCRVYRRRDGRISPTPDPDDLRDVLRRAAVS
jgi:type IV pilus biogenesis protein CpaD/CtpE